MIECASRQFNRDSVMKIKHMVIAVLAGLGLLIWTLSDRRQKTYPQARRKAEIANATSTAVDKPNEYTARPHSEFTRADVAYELHKIEIAVDTHAEDKQESARRFRIVGSENKIRIVDSRGNTVIDLDSNPHLNNITSKCTANQNGKRILVDYGADAAYDVVEPDTGLKVSLPIQPPGEYKLGFSAWQWIDGDTLLGESGDEIVDRKSGVEGEDNVVARTRLYVYSINRQELAEVQFPEGFGVKIFSVTQISPKGYIHLVHGVPDTTRLADLGWFAVAPK